MTDHTKYLIIGGGLAGGYAVQGIRKLDTSGRLVLVTEENEFPYDRVPLSKTYLAGRLSRESVFLKKPDFYSEQRVEILAGRSASKLDISARSLVISSPDGSSSEITFERLLLATGGRPKRLRIPGGDLSGVHYLRTIQDSESIKFAMESSYKAVVVGGGFIGCEVAAALASKGLQTTLLELGQYVLSLAIDEETGRWITEFRTRNGVKVLTGSSARKLRRGVPDFAKGGGFAQFYMRGDKRIGAFLEIGRPLDEVQTCRRLVSSRRVIEDPSRLSDESYDLNQLLT